jgi:hypothetical protein
MAQLEEIYLWLPIRRVHVGGVTRPILNGAQPFATVGDKAGRHFRHVWVACETVEPTCSGISKIETTSFPFQTPLVTSVKRAIE